MSLEDVVHLLFTTEPVNYRLLVKMPFVSPSVWTKICCQLGIGADEAALFELLCDDNYRIGDKANYRALCKQIVEQRWGHCFVLLLNRCPSVKSASELFQVCIFEDADWAWRLMPERWLHDYYGSWSFTVWATKQGRLPLNLLCSEPRADIDLWSEAMQGQLSVTPEDLDDPRLQNRLRITSMRNAFVDAMVDNVMFLGGFSQTFSKGTPRADLLATAQVWAEREKKTLGITWREPELVTRPKHIDYSCESFARLRRWLLAKNADGQLVIRMPNGSAEIARHLFASHYLGFWHQDSLIFTLLVLHCEAKRSPSFDVKLFKIDLKEPTLEDSDVWAKASLPLLIELWSLIRANFSIRAYFLKRCSKRIDFLEWAHLNLFTSSIRRTFSKLLVDMSPSELEAFIKGAMRIPPDKILQVLSFSRIFNRVFYLVFKHRYDLALTQTQLKNFAEIMSRFRATEHDYFLKNLAIYQTFYPPFVKYFADCRQRVKLKYLPH